MNLAELQNFHFIRPELLLAIPVLLILWFVLGRGGRATAWESFIPREKLEALLVSGGSYRTAWRWLLAGGWVIAIIATAGPTWQKLPVPTLRSEGAMVIALDLSQSMLAQDLAPDRLTRAKLKLIDILRQRQDGQTALIAYAGESHSVSPLTDDPRTIEALLPALHPAIMPTQGSNTESAINLANQMLRDAGMATGELLILTDGIAPQAQRYIQDQLQPGYRLSILGVGTSEKVPIPRPDGGFIRDSRGEIVLTQLNRNELDALATGKGGRYVELQADDSDVLYLLENDTVARSSQEPLADLTHDQWHDMGFWLVLLLLPLAAISFRRGLVFLFPLILIGSPDIQAQSLPQTWRDLWQTPDQQGAELMRAEDAAGAADRFEDSDWSGTAHFRNQDFERAEQQFSMGDSAENHYNRGTALAYQSKFEEAVEAYNKALELDPGMEDALHNREVVQKLLEQQQNQQQQQNQDQQNSDEQNDSDNQDSESDSQQSQSEQQNSEQENSEQNSDSSEESSSEQNQQQNSDSEAQSKEEQSKEEQAQQQQNAENEDDGQEAQAREQQEQSEQEAQAAERLESMIAEPTPDQLQDSSEQWLRAIPDDPSGLLRRKFQFQSRQRSQDSRYSPPDQNPDDQRY